MLKKRMILVLICVLAGCMLFTACRKKENTKGESESTSEAVPVPTLTPSPAAGDTADNGENPGTQETADQTEPDTASESGILSEEEAIKSIQDIIGERGYYFDLVKDNLDIEDHTYFEFQISDSSGPIEPDVLVNKADGKLLCLNSDGSTSPFSDHPLYVESDTGVESDTSEDNGFTKEDALARLGKVPLKDLGLSEKLSEYKVVFDDWTTNIKGADCYGINVYSDEGDKMVSKGLFYVATDGSVMYKFDASLDDFAEIKAQ